MLELLKNKNNLNKNNKNAYALSRPPGHHCLPDLPNGFCLLSNIGIAVESAIAQKLTDRVAIIDWDVHHGNGTQEIFIKIRMFFMDLYINPLYFLELV